MLNTMIPLTGTAIQDFTPTFFKGDGAPAKPPIFYLRVPTFAIRDKMAAVLFQRGLIPATLPQSRGILIDALYELYDEATADDHAAFLESYWTRSEVHDELVQGWQIREAQRLFDLGMGVKKKEALEPEPIPPAPYTMREQARQASVVTNVLENHERFRTYQARFMVQTEEEEQMLMRLFVADWKNVGEVPCIRDELDRIELDSIEQARGWLEEQGAVNAWNEVKDAVKAQLGGGGGLEKNFDSLLDMNSSLTGSLTSSGDLASSDGSSTTSPTGPTQNTGSRRKSGTSRGSRSAKGAKRQAAS